MEWVKVSDPRVPIDRQTIYRWLKQGKYPELIVRVCGRVLFDIELWNQMIQDQLEQNKKEAHRKQIEYKQKQIEKRKNWFVYEDEEE